MISSRAYELVLEQALLGFQMRVEKANPTDVVHIGAWNVVPLVGSSTASVGAAQGEAAIEGNPILIVRLF